MAIVRKAKYIKSDVAKNNNKFWYIEEHDDATVTTYWGRVGEEGQSKTKDFGSQSQASAFYDRKCHEKERSGRNDEIAYRKLDVIDGDGAVSQKVVASGQLKDVAVKQIDTNCPEVSKLIARLAKENVHNILQSTTMKYNVDTGLFTTPCGIVTQDSIDDANDILVKISDYVDRRDFTSGKLATLVGDYLMLIPQAVGRKLIVKDVFPDLGAIRQQKAILDSLEASFKTVINGNANTKATKTDTTPKLFDVKLHLVDDQAIVRRIRKKYGQTRQSRHACQHLDVKKVYIVEIGPMKSAFDKCTIGNVMELWHGTRTSNLLSILKGGLMIPPRSNPNVTGRMWSDGLYFSDQSTKSLNYAYGYWGGSRSNNCFMFLADVAMGKYFVPHSTADGPFPKKGYDSVFAKAHKSGVYNNEMIVYSTSQANLTYLIEFSA